MQATVKSPNRVTSTIASLAVSLKGAGIHRNRRRSSSGWRNQTELFGGVHEETWFSRNGINLPAGNAARGQRPKRHGANLGNRGGSCRRRSSGRHGPLDPRSVSASTQLHHRVERLIHFHRPCTGLV